MIELFSRQPALIGLLVFFGVAFILSEFLKPQRRSRNQRKYQQWKQHGNASTPDSPGTVNSADQLVRVMAANFYKKTLLNKSEFRLFLAVEREITQSGLDWRLMAQVSLGEILGSKDTSAFWAINSKRVDLLLIDKEGAPLHVIEYQGSGHHQGNAAVRDAVKKEALRKAGIGYHEIAAGDRPEDLRALMTKLTRNGPSAVQSPLGKK
jgi:Protein of unknown function (DUF2726)